MTYFNKTQAILKKTLRNLKNEISIQKQQNMKNYNYKIECLKKQTKYKKNQKDNFKYYIICKSS